MVTFSNITLHLVTLKKVIFGYCKVLEANTQSTEFATFLCNL